MVICCQALYSFAQTGKVGIGIITPKALLHVAESNVSFTGASKSLPGEQRTGYIGNVFETAIQTKLTFFARNSARILGERYYIMGNGGAWLQGSLTQNSDARLKKDIAPLSNSLEAILQINGYLYHWKDASNPKKQIGPLAQEVQQVYPELVKENNDGKLGVNYAGMVPVQVIKEQQRQIVEQNKRIAELKRK